LLAAATRRMVGEAVVRLDMGGVYARIEAKTIDEALASLSPIESPGTRAEGGVCSFRLPRPFHLPGGDTEAIRRSGGARRSGATVRKSLPSVVGEGGCPWCAREPSRRRDAAEASASAPDHALERGQQNPVRPPSAQSVGR